MTGDNFHESTVLFCFFTFSTEILVPSGTEKPAFNDAAGFPTMSAFNFAPAQFFMLAFTPKAGTLQELFLFFVNEVRCDRLEFFNKLIVDFFIDEAALFRHKPYHCQMIWNITISCAVAGC